MTTPGPGISTVLVTRNHEVQIGHLLGALRPQLGPDDEVILVDNSSFDGTIAVATDALPCLRVIRSGGNIGFSGACNAGVAIAAAPLVLLLNPDCIPQPGCMDALRACAGERTEWGAWQAAVLLPDGRINSRGNIAHFLGLSWAGGLFDSSSKLPSAPVQVSFCSGAALVVRREAWRTVGGFDDRYFMYCEDLDLCFRLRLQGWETGLVPAARVAHDYEFVKGDYKWFYLERNRWWTVLSTYPTPLLLTVLPALLALELLLLVIAARGGWMRAKLAAQVAVLRELPQILQRRASIQGRRQITSMAFARLLVSTLDSPMLQGTRAMPWATAVLGAYWRAVKWLIR